MSKNEYNCRALGALGNPKKKFAKIGAMFGCAQRKGAPDETLSDKPEEGLHRSRNGFRWHWRRPGGPWIMEQSDFSCSVMTNEESRFSLL